MLKNDQFLYRAAQRQHRQLLYDQERFSKYIENLNSTSDQLMIDKFGRPVDLEVLEMVTINKGLEEARERLISLEELCSKELAGLEVVFRLIYYLI